MAAEMWLMMKLYMILWGERTMNESVLQEADENHKLVTEITCWPPGFLDMQ